MEIYFDGFELYEDDKPYHISKMNNNDNNGNDIDTIVSLCETAKQSFHLITPRHFYKVNLKHHSNMSIGEKEYCMKIIYEVWQASINEDLFYQHLISRICLSPKVALMMMELLKDIQIISLNDVPL